MHVHDMKSKDDINRPRIHICDRILENLPSTHR